MDVRRAVGVLAGVLVGVPMLVAGPGSAAAPGRTAAAAEPPTCRGVPATIVGEGTLIGTSGDDVIVATKQSTRVRAGKGDDLVCGSHFVRGQAGNDRIHVTGRKPGWMHIEGGTGNDVIRFHGRVEYASVGTSDGIFGGPGDDLMVGGKGQVWLNGGWGDDRLVSGPRGDLLDGDGGNDVLLGGAGQDIISGGKGNDVMRGRTRSDELTGGPGRDVAWGGPGWDVCRRGNEVEHSCEADSWI